jgi:hypothetical protein
MNDDWRLQVDLHEPGHAGPLEDLLGARELEHDLSNEFQDRVIVSRDGARVFLYAGSREQAERARELIVKLDEQEQWSADVDFKRWHPIAQEWEDPDEPLPKDDGGGSAEHEAMLAEERRRTEESGHPEFEVRVDLSSRHEAERLAERLRAEGLPTVRRWRYLLVGADDEDSAKALADRLREEAPADAQVSAEGTWQEAYAERPPNPFAVFGGLGG